MAIDTEVLGEQLAADLAAQARAREELLRTRPGGGDPVRDLLPLLVVMPLAVIFMPLGGDNLRWVATVLVMVVVWAVIELRRLSRRLEAALVLLKPHLDDEVRR